MLFCMTAWSLKGIDIGKTPGSCLKNSCEWYFHSLVCRDRRVRGGGDRGDWEAEHGGEEGGGGGEGEGRGGWRRR